MIGKNLLDQFLEIRAKALQKKDGRFKFGVEFPTAEEERAGQKAKFYCSLGNKTIKEDDVEKLIESIKQYYN